MPRILELLLVSIMLVALLPVMIVVAAAIVLTLGWPVIFLQKRAGYQGRIFQIIKFRSMRRGRAGPVDTSTDSDRMTRLGRFLRKTSLDELPELLNVLKGQMALVGPRPLLPEYLELYDDEQARRHDVRPGITGWAQVNGRNAIDWPQRFELDVWYVDHRSTALDLRILLMTVLQIFRFGETSQPGRATQDKFTGASS